MVKFKKSIMALTAVCTIGLTASGVFAASKFNTPMEALASLTGQSVESIQKQKTEEDKSLGAIAKEADKLNEFKAETLKLKKDRLDQMVKDGTITQDEANKMLQSIKEKQANCNGDGQNKGIGKGLGKGMGMGKGNCQGMGSCTQSK
ncbi:MAG: hypothetical protein RR840_08190 [Clostridium sp.]